MNLKTIRGLLIIQTWFFQRDLLLLSFGFLLNVIFECCEHNTWNSIPLHRFWFEAAISKTDISKPERVKPKVFLCVDITGGKRGKKCVFVNYLIKVPQLNCAANSVYLVHFIRKFIAALHGLLPFGRHLISLHPSINLQYLSLSFSAGSRKVSSNIYDINNCL